jgi:hypothetical protein
VAAQTVGVYEQAIARNAAFEISEGKPQC